MHRIWHSDCSSDNQPDGVLMNDQTWQLSSNNIATARMQISIGHALTSPDLDDAEFLRCWHVYDSQLDGAAPRRRINWNAILGVGIVVGVSAGFWAGLALAVAYLVK